ncbi:DEAD/DEAH box helicase [Lacticaseibacillus parakribbianus]|uniref:DEAD/DEAH box helicase n=1 Tax=Lacticaseibacillus parakribbianus TaxID=2970927 RepID=UPI0021CB0ABD|nr:SNF2 family helicase [Lacticaseibacillus parakribbianus]
MENRYMPSGVWAAGRKLAADHRVALNGVVGEGAQDSGLVMATVDDGQVHEVSVGVDPYFDDCDCADFEAHGYCAHIAAVVQVLKNAGLSIAAAVADGLADLMPRPAGETPTPGWRSKRSSGGAFLDALGVTPHRYFKGLRDPDAVSVNQLALEVTVALMNRRTRDWTREPRIFVRLRIQDVAVGRFNLVPNLQDFLATYNRQGTYYINTNAFALSPAAFNEDEQALLAELAAATPVDRDMLEYNDNYHRYVMLAPGAFARLEPLLRRIGYDYHPNTGNAASYPGADLQPLTPEAGVLVATVSQTKAGFELLLTLDYQAMLAADHLLVRGQHLYQMTAAQLAPFNRLVTQVLQNDPQADSCTLEFGRSEVALLRDFLTMLAPLATISAPSSLMAAAPTSAFSLDYAKGTVLLTLTLPGATAEVERQAHDYLRELGFSFRQGLWRKRFADAEATYRFFVAELPNLRDNGTVTTTPAVDALLQDGAALAPAVAVESRDGLLSINFSLKGVSPQAVDAMLAQLDVSRPYLTRPDGGLVLVDGPLKATVAALAKVRQAAKWQDGKLAVPASQALAVQAALGDKAAFDARFATLVQDLTHPEAFAPAAPTRPVQATLRPYQVTGVKWLEMLYHHGFGGILADEMGLGKTLQMISLVNAHVEAGRPSLVVAPASLLYNWEAEFAKFAPWLKVAVVDGTKAQRKATVTAGTADVLIASYNSVRLDIAEYQGLRLQLLVLDEAQFVKNASAKTSQALRRLHPQNTFGLSGTPIENRPEELWALFTLILPGLLPSLQAFKKLTPEEVAIRVKPFILRREKATVLKDLPPLSETNLTNEMTGPQKAVYLAQLQQMQVQVRGLGNQALVHNKLAILAGLTRLRQLCNTPALFVPGYTGGSGKLEQLAELVKEAADSGRHVLIFSQFTQMLAQVQGILDAAHLPTFVLTGDTPAAKRLTMVDAFNAGKRNFFLVSLKAGGTGLNLTGADMVILVDLWWNPAVEDQAIARAHRIGQTRSVDVYRLITKGTIEEQIVKLQAKKRDLVDQILSGTENKASLTPEEIRLILGVEE